MGRPLRIEYPDAFYHVTARGNERKEIFKSEKDREQFLSYLESAVTRYGAVVHCYCLMTNHYHLLVETPAGNLSQIMQHINGAYTNYFNTKRKRTGHLFQGRYKGILVEADEYALQLSRYIHLNPVRLKADSELSDYSWSSYPEYIGKRKAPEWLTTTFILGYFDTSQPAAQKRYRQFVEEMIGKEHESPLLQTVASTLLGTPEFIAAVQEQHLDGKTTDRNVPALNQLQKKPTIDRIIEMAKNVIADDERLAAKAAIYLCHRHSGAKLKEIGERFGVKESAVSQSSRRFAEDIEKDKKLHRVITELGRQAGL